MRQAAQLYLLTPPQFCPNKFSSMLTTALAAGGKDIWGLQLRLKSTDDQPADDASWIESSAVLRPIARNAGIKFLLNDRADLVDATQADGVHLGQSDMPLQRARALLGADAHIGITCHASHSLAKKAQAAGADYVAFGAFYDSPTKTATTRARPDLLTQWQRTSTLPCAAIGGITPQNATPLIRAGANYLAVTHAIWQHPQTIAAAVGAFLDGIHQVHLAQAD